MVELESTWYQNEDGSYTLNETVFERIYGIMSILYKEGNVFTGKRDRLDYSSWGALIKYNKEEVGFIYITKEQRYNPGLFLDMAIIKDYRGLGIAKEALSIFLNAVNTERFIIGETKKNNAASNPLGDDLGIKILEDKYNYYLFPKSRYEEFMEFNEDHRFEKAMLKDTLDSGELIRQLYEQENNKTLTRC